MSTKRQPVVEPSHLIGAQILNQKKDWRGEELTIGWLSIPNKFNIKKS